MKFFTSFSDDNENKLKSEKAQGRKLCITIKQTRARNRDCRKV